MNSFTEKVDEIFGSLKHKTTKGIELPKDTKTSKDWIYLNINGSYEDRSGVLDKSYFSFKNLKNFDPKTFAEFAEFLQAEGLKIQIKIFKKVERGVLFNDQVVMYGKDSEKALDLAEAFFGNKIKKQGLGRDKMVNGDWVTYTEQLAQEIKDHIASK